MVPVKSVLCKNRFWRLPRFPRLDGISPDIRVLNSDNSSSLLKSPKNAGRVPLISTLLCKVNTRRSFKVAYVDGIDPRNLLESKVKNLSLSKVSPHSLGRVPVKSLLSKNKMFRLINSENLGERGPERRLLSKSTLCSLSAS